MLKRGVLPFILLQFMLLTILNNNVNATERFIAVNSCYFYFKSKKIGSRKLSVGSESNNVKEAETLKIVKILQKMNF